MALPPFNVILVNNHFIVGASILPIRIYKIYFTLPPFISPNYSNLSIMLIALSFTPFLDILAFNNDGDNRKNYKKTNTK